MSQEVVVGVKEDGSFEVELLDAHFDQRSVSTGGTDV